MAEFFSADLDQLPGDLHVGGDRMLDTIRALAYGGVRDGGFARNWATA